MSEETIYVYRDAVTGEFVTALYAHEHPDTTVREEIKQEEDE